MSLFVGVHCRRLQMFFRLGLGKFTCSETSRAWLHVVRINQAP